MCRLDTQYTKILVKAIPLRRMFLQGRHTQSDPLFLLSVAAPKKLENPIAYRSCCDLRTIESWSARHWDR